MIVCGFNTFEENHMAESRRTDAVRILHHRYIRSDPTRLAELDRERLNAELAQLIYDRRVAAGLTQKELARLGGTTQSVIPASRTRITRGTRCRCCTASRTRSGSG
jgi:ribosome-binding protein aMBF1 (putative translation factor)